MTCGCPSSGHMAHPSSVNKVINYLFNDPSCTSMLGVGTLSHQTPQGGVGHVGNTSVMSAESGVGVGVNNKLSISSLSDTDSGCYVTDRDSRSGEYAWVPSGLTPKQVGNYLVNC